MEEVFILELTWGIGLLAIVGGLLSGFMNSIVGGGGMISLPIYMMMGLPTTMALGSNKVSSLMGSTMSSLAFIRNGKVNRHLMIRFIPLSFIGSICGVALAMVLPSDFLRTLVIVLLFGVCLLTIFKKDWGTYSTYRPLTGVMFFAGCVATFIFGFYDGFFGPGVGTFLIFAFLLIGCDFIEAAGNAQVLNWASNLAAAIAFIYFGAVDWSLALLMGAAQIVGSLIGTRLAILKGASWVRPIFLTVSVLLIGRQLWTLFH